MFGIMKKSENIEIRIDHETKLALQERAEGDDQTVSEVLRGLIGAYLRPGKPVGQVRNKLREYSGWVVAGLLLMFSGSSFVPLAAAASIKLDFRSEITEHAEDGQRLQTSDYQVEFDGQGEPVRLPIGSGDHVIEISVRAVELKDQGQVADMRLKIIHINGDKEEVIAEPYLIGKLDQLSSIEIGAESDTTYKIELIPSGLD